MKKIEVRKTGKFYFLNGEITFPSKFFGIDGFKFVNHVWSWVLGGALGESGGAHLDRARRYLEREVLGNGCRRMRAPVELMFWGPPYFNFPGRPNVANTFDLVNLASQTGSGYHATSGLRKVIRMYVNLAREFEIVIEVPWLWTIKGRGENDPRVDVSRWNEHFIGNEAEGIGRYLRLLRDEGDGEGEHRVDPGPLNLLSDAMNEFTVHSERWVFQQLLNVSRRWHDRDAKGELLLISQSGPADRYEAPLATQYGANGYDGVCLHPPRDGEWESNGSVSRKRFPNELIDFNESMLGWTEKDAEKWLPLIPKWGGLASTDLDRWGRMHADHVSNDIYTTFHTLRGMDAGWPESPQTKVEEVIREVSGAASPSPPPPPPPPPPVTPKLSIRRNDLQELVIERDPEVVKGGSEDFVLRDSLEVLLPLGRFLERVHVFHGLDRGDLVEMDTEIHVNGKTLYTRSDHKETPQPFDAWETYDPTDYEEEVRRVRVFVSCRVTARNPLGFLQARPHFGVRMVWK